VRRTWEQEGRPIPPPTEVKQQILRDHVRRFGLRRLVETGTFLGETAAALAGDVDEVISIELSEALHQRALERFARRSNVKLLHGDSEELLPRVAAESAVPTLFWLDAHYSRDGVTARGRSDTPVVEELRALLSLERRSDVILVDDASALTGRDGWPGIDDLRDLVRDHGASLAFEIADDVVRIYDERLKRNSPQA
jgi:hypothetical protein